MNSIIDKIFISLLLTILPGSSLLAQDPVIPELDQQNKYNFSQFGNETWNFIKQPGKWDGSDWLKIGLISAGTFLIMETSDHPIRDAVLRNPGYYNSFPVEFGRMWGELYAPCILFSGFAVYSFITDEMGARKVAYEIGQASLYAGAFAFLLKLAIGRARPYMEEGTASFHPFSSFFVQDTHSLPGGHTTAAFVLSTVLSRNAGPVWLKALAYLPAVLTFGSRVYQDKHWTSDDFMGAAIGYLIATWVVDQHENINSIVEVSSTFPLFIRVALN